MYQTTKLAKRLRIALLAICIFALAFALVACGEKDDNNKNTNSSDDFFADDGYFSKSAIESYIAYMVTNTNTREGQHSSIMCGNVFGEVIDGVQQNFVITVTINGDNKALLVCFPDGYLQDHLDDIDNYPGYTVNVKGNYVIYESVPGIWENEILKATMPANAMPQSRLDFIYESCKTIYDEYSNGRADSFTVGCTVSNEGQSFIAHCNSLGENALSNSETTIQCLPLNNVEDFDVDGYKEADFDEKYTADSYVRIDEEEGYLYEKRVTNPDFVF